MHETCPYCGKVIVADSSDLNRLLQAHIQTEHEQGYRRSDSWRTCPYCGGRGKDVYGIICHHCKGSGMD